MLKIICPNCESDCINYYITDECKTVFQCDTCAYEFGIQEMELDHE
ncbi:hypothetical protein [Clostridium botulinum]|nr:hypothetical protein [Clostridium botulinum]MCC5426877.1 hypothetical protein [Clostridium botulinum]